ncbi:hypothetical protein H072_3314 [Dactylellina haptotyla CBS 200.50]|jgi:hypothetical protein|uniref:Uncharacterized protein n=1 Tax=Dactylellina haptotyla (strain CBS 200.50) TaxID=1284197 RepID=S8BT70_DACHA|nr:hypothetical protein H072_3314 [Dactylellina haptotyla CBS 200.50]
MVAYKKSASALLLSAAVAAAQNGTYEYAGPQDITYTTMIPSLCETGLVDVPYTIKQHCEYGPCVQPEVPYGWEVKTKYCEHGCGPEPTYVAVTECPWESPAPTPACYGAGCHKDEIICPSDITYTHWYEKPTGVPPPVYSPPPPPPATTPCPTPSPMPPVMPPVMPPATTCITQVYPPPPPPPTKPEVPCNTTIPPPPMYTGAAGKTVVSGVLGFVAVAFAALL